MKFYKFKGKVIYKFKIRFGSKLRKIENFLSLENNIFMPDN